MSNTKGLRNFATRLFFIVLGIPAILLLIRVGKIPFTVFIGLVSVLAQIEFYNLMIKKGFNPWIITGIISGSAWIGVTYLAQGLLFPLLILIVLVHAGQMLFKSIDNATGNVAVTLFGFFYFPLMLSILILLRESPHQYNGDYSEGSQLVMIVFATIWICDSLAFVFGKLLGKRKIVPTISPGKTWVGCIGGLMGALATVILIHYLGWKPDYLQLKDLIVIGVIAGIFGQSGDFIESVIKRDVAVKDSGTLLMGHGGVMDRFDSFLIAPACIYLYLFFFI